MYIKTRESHLWGATADKAPMTHTGGSNTTAPLHQLPKPVPALCRHPLFHFLLQKKKQQRRKKTKITEQAKKKGGGQNHQKHTHTAQSARTPEQGARDHEHRAGHTKGVSTGEQAASGPGHRTRTCTESGKRTGRNGPHPQGSDALGRPSRPAGPLAGAVPRDHWSEPGQAASPPAPCVPAGSVCPHVSVGRVTCPPLWVAALGAAQPCGVSLITGGIAPASLRYDRLIPVAGLAGPRCLAGDPLLGCVPARLSSFACMAPGDSCHGPLRHCPPKPLRERLKSHLT